MIPPEDHSRSPYQYLRLSLKTQKNWDQPSDTRVAPHCHIVLFVVILLDTTKAPYFYLDNGSYRKILASAVEYVSKADCEEASGK